jgi:hypothetical protein
MCPSTLRLAVSRRGREQRAGVDEEETAVPIDPEHVRVPVVVARRLLGWSDGASEQIEELLRAANDHGPSGANSTGVGATSGKADYALSA